MALIKHASFAVLEAQVANGPTLLRTAHRVAFEYTPRPGFLYVRSRAISSRCNDNYDEFPAAELRTAYRTFVGKPVFVNHRNDDHRRARGVIIDAVLHDDVNPDGSDDTWVEVLMEVDALRFPRLAAAILNGDIDRTSMGTDVAYSVCSFCGNKAATPVEYCSHIPKLKGKRIRRRTASGTQEDVLVREICYGLKFFENSLLVEQPADPTAFFLGVDDRGLQMAASRRTAADKKFIVVDTGMIQGERGGKGGSTYFELHIDGCADLNRPKYNYCNKFPQHGADWRDAIERLIDDFQSQDQGFTAEDVRVLPCAKSGVPVEAPIKVLDPSLCPGTGMPINNPRGNLYLPCPVCGTSLGTGRGTVPRHKKQAEFVYGEITVGQWPNDKIEKHIARRDMQALCGAGRVEYDKPLKDSPVRGTCTQCVSIWKNAGTTATRKVASLKTSATYEFETWQVEDPETWAKKYPLFERKGDWCTNVIAWNPQGFGSDIITGWGDSAEAAEADARNQLKVLTKHAYGETMAPPEVDAIGQQACPVCGNEASYDGDTCMVCGFIRPPEQFMDPDLTKAKEIDRRMDGEESIEVPNDGPQLQCDSCGATYPTSPENTMRAASRRRPRLRLVARDSILGGPYWTAAIPTNFELKKKPKDDEADDDKANPPSPDDDEEDDASKDDDQTADDESADDANTDGDADKDKGSPKAGDPCPDCGKGTLQTVKSKDDTDKDDEGDDQDAKPTDDTDNGDGEDKDSGTKDESDDGDKPEFLKKKTDGKGASLSSLSQGVPVAMTTNPRQDRRTLFAAVAEQSLTAQIHDMALKAVNAKIDRLARLAGVDMSDIDLKATARIANLRRQAESENPGSPLPDAPAQAPTMTTDQAAAPAATTAVDALDATVLADVNPMSTDPTAPVVGQRKKAEEILPPAPADVVDVTAPVAGTETPDPAGDAQSDPQVGQPVDLNPANPVVLGAAENRVYAALNLARLRIAAGAVSGDDLVEAQRISNSGMTMAAINGEIKTLTSVVRSRSTTASDRRPRPSLATAASVRTPEASPLGVATNGDSALFE
jgi:hypothetical protein